MFLFLAKNVLGRLKLFHFEAYLAKQSFVI